MSEDGISQHARAGVGARSSGRLVGLLVAPAGVVTSLLLLALRLHFQPPNVPEYGLAGDAGGDFPFVAVPGSIFEFEATPAIEVQGAVTARAFLVRESGTSGGADGGAAEDVRAWRVPMEIGRDGSVHVAGPVDRLFAGVPPGEWEVAVVVGRPELLPRGARELVELLKGRGAAGDRSASASAAAWRVVRRRVSLR